MEAYVDKIWELVSLYGVSIVTALVVFVVGRWVAKGVRKLITRLMKKAQVDPTLVGFTSNIAYIGLLAFVVVAALGQLGIQTTSFIAILGAAGLAVGLALQGSLSNFAAGFLMIIFKPFKVGDYIQGAGQEGTVEKIQIFTTSLVTLDNKTVIVPNAKLTEDNIVNWTAKGTRRVDLVFGIGYGDDIDKARKIIEDVLGRDSRILADPAAQISVSELGDSSVNFVVRPWVKCDDYWGVYMDTTENIKKAFDDGGVNIPFPQRDVHLYQH
ncbi:MAG: mechanosensitive ion channel [Deltaproteobacteria bacterium]|nr:mechanosensitive ion channel [Deltaproteobacteria bacterium]